MWVEYLTHIIGSMLSSARIAPGCTLYSFVECALACQVVVVICVNAKCKVEVRGMICKAELSYEAAIRCNAHVL